MSVTWKEVFLPPMERFRLRLPRDVDTTTFARMHLIRELGGKCRICGSKNDLEIHHIIPRAEGGPTNMKNLTPLCEKCHRNVTSWGTELPSGESKDARLFEFTEW